MIERYTPAAFAELWSEEAKYKSWLQVELAACEAMEAAGHCEAVIDRALESA